MACMTLKSDYCSRNIAACSRIVQVPHVLYSPQVMHVSNMQQCFEKAF
jgi:hypothetical protein